MKKTILLTSLSLLLMSSFAQAGLYRWVDDKGEVHFSDKVPAAATKKVVDEIHKMGGVKNTVDPEAKIREKLELKKNEKALAVAKVKEQAERDAIEQQRKRDEYLLSTYENKQEIIVSFRSKLKLMRGNAAILETQNIVLEKKLKKLKNRKVISKEYKKKIVSISKTINDYKKALKQNKSEQLNISNNYKVFMKRYSELTNK